jgi:hypothetical protein
MKIESKYKPMERNINTLKNGIDKFDYPGRRYRMYYDSKREAVQIEVKERGSDSYSPLSPEMQTRNHGLLLINNEKSHNISFQEFQSKKKTRAS